jgi:hypothetical protein
MTQETIFDQWAIVEVFGHSRYAGRVTEEKIGSVSFVRVDVPAVKDFAAFTKLLGGSSIFAITPVAEDVARKAAEQFRSRPVEVLHYPHTINSQSQLGFDYDSDYDDGE